MNCNIFVCVVVLSFVAVCVEGGLHCLHTVSVDVGSAYYCVYAQLENGKEYQFCNADSHITYNLPPFPNSTMNKCEKFPGYLKFMKCNTNNCNTGCEITAPTTTTKSEVTTEQATTTSVASTTAFPTTKEKTTTTRKQTSKVLDASTEPSSTAIPNTTNNGTVACQKDEQDHDLSNQLPLTNVFDNKQVNVVYNIPSTSNNCECRCNQDKTQNNLFVA